MATYKVWLTVKNSAGNTKEIPVGNINVDATLTPEMLSQIEEALLLEDYLKKTDIETELNEVIEKSKKIIQQKDQIISEYKNKFDIILSRAKEEKTTFGKNKIVIEFSPLEFENFKDLV